MAEQASVDEELFAAASSGDVSALTRLLDAHPDRLLARDQPYEHTPLHVAAREGHLAAVNLLLERGIDANVLEKGDRTSPMHWAAAAGHLDVVQRLADAGGDVIGAGDDHGLEVIGWATFWSDAPNRAVAGFLISRGAHHHIYSAMALEDEAEVRRIVARSPGALNHRLTRNDNHQTPLHWAVLHRRPRMVELLMELGADPLATDGGGQGVTGYATDPDTDVAVMRAIRAMTLAELDSAERGKRDANLSSVDLLAAVALGDWPLAEQLASVKPHLVHSDVLQFVAKRNAIDAARWLIAHGANVNERHAHWGSDLTPLHVAVWHDHRGMVRLLLDAGADVTIKDTQFDGNALDWADHFERAEVRRILLA